MSVKISHPGYETGRLNCHRKARCTPHQRCLEVWKAQLNHHSYIFNFYAVHNSAQKHVVVQTCILQKKKNEKNNIFRFVENYAIDSLFTTCPGLVEMVDKQLADGRQWRIEHHQLGGYGWSTWMYHRYWFKNVTLLTFCELIFFFWHFVCKEKCSNKMKPNFEWPLRDFFSAQMLT